MLTCIASLFFSAASTWAGLECPQPDIERVIAIAKELKREKCQKPDLLKEASFMLKNLSQEVSCPKAEMAAALETLNTLRAAIVLNDELNHCSESMDAIDLSLGQLISSKKNKLNQKAKK